MESGNGATDLRWREGKASRVSGGMLKWLAGLKFQEIAAEPFARRGRD
jgi:hypothetical protein